MERGDLLEANGGIFKPQGEAINADAADDVRVLVVGNPANTNALIALAARARRARRALHRDDAARPQPRAQPAAPPRPSVTVNDIKRLTIWGNHSATQYPDIFHAQIGGRPAAERRRRPGLARERLHPDASPSAAPRSSRLAARRRPPRPRTPPIDHVHDWVDRHAGR